jgi:hypothetical protein
MHLEMAMAHILIRLHFALSIVHAPFEMQVALTMAYVMLKCAWPMCYGIPSCQNVIIWVFVGTLAEIYT